MKRLSKIILDERFKNRWLFHDQVVIKVVTVDSVKNSRNVRIFATKKSTVYVKSRIIPENSSRYT